MSPEELSMVEASSTVEEKYVKANDSIGDRFVDTIKYVGAEPMNDMLKNSDDGISSVREFYNILKGENVSINKFY